MPMTAMLIASFGLSARDVNFKKGPAATVATPAFFKKFRRLTMSILLKIPECPSLLDHLKGMAYPESVFIVHGVACVSDASKKPFGQPIIDGIPT